MDFDKIIDNSTDEMLELMKTDEFKNRVDKDATIPFVIDYVKISMKNYHKELAKILASKGIDV
jgi:hypothetical protein